MKRKTKQWLIGLGILMSIATLSWILIRSSVGYGDVYHPPATLSGPLVVLVTGGAGFIGSHVARALLERGDQVVIVDEFNDYYDVRVKEANVHALLRDFALSQGAQGSFAFDESVTLSAARPVVVVRGDIADEALMQRVFETYRFQAVCHLAARAGVRPSIEVPGVYVHSNVLGTTVLLEMAARYPVQNFVLASTSSVYGESEKVPFSEVDRVDKPVSPYAATKLGCELMAYTYHRLYGTPVNVVRFFTVYGPSGRPDMAPYKFIRAVLRGEPIQRYGDGSSLRDYTFIADIVDGVVAALDHPFKYEIFNLGRGQPIPLNHFIQIIEEEVGKDAIIVEMPDQPGDVSRTHADVSKARLLLGYRPKVSTREGVRITVEWLRNQLLKSS